MKSRLLSDPVDGYAGLRQKARRAAAKLGVDLSQIRLNDPRVLKAMVSERASHAGQSQKLWAPFASPSVRRIMKLAGIKDPAFEDFMHLHRLTSARAYGSGFLDEYVARRRGADVISIVASTYTEDGRTALRLLDKPRKIRRPAKTPACLKPFLAETFGMLMFDDQLIAIGADVGGLSSPRALALYHGISNSSNQRRIAQDFLAGAKSKGFCIAEIDEALWYIGYTRYSQPSGRSDSRRYVREAYEHCLLWLRAGSSRGGHG